MNKDDWELFKKTVEPLRNRKKLSFQTKTKTKLVDERKNKKNKEDIELIDIVVSDDWGNLEKNILKNIQKGKIKISSTLDLHGFNLEDSKKLVFNFINNNYNLQNRLLLLITGKGKRVFIDNKWKSIGKLKEQIPLWLNSLALSQKIIWFDYAPAEKGGEGAFLIYLKKTIK